MQEITLWKHQKLAVEKAKTRDNLFLAMDTGTGKSLTALEILRYHCNTNKRLHPTIVFCPLSITLQWKQSFLRFTKIPEDKLVILTGEKKKRIQKFEDAYAKYGRNFVIIVNYEATRIDDVNELLLKKFMPELVILDESHTLKSHTSLAFKKILKLTNQAQYRYLLTGTPVANSPIDLFAQYMLLDKGQTFGTNFFEFRCKYFYDRNARMPKAKHFPDWQIREGALEHISQAIANSMVQAKKEDCLDLPPLLRVDVPVQMSPAQEKAYKEMEEEFITQIATEGEFRTVTADFAITKSMRLQQMLCGFTRDVEGNVVWFDDVPRLDAMETLLGELKLTDERIIIWVQHEPTYAKMAEICEKLKLTYCFMTGKETAEEKQQSVKDFKSGVKKVMIAHPKAGGAGLDLYESKYAIYFFRSFSKVEFEQSEARNYRGGSEQHDKVVHYHLYCAGTVEDSIKEALIQKKNISDAIMNFSLAQK